MKTQKGITLVALIITIVVLLVLAVVSINSIQNEGIMLQAQNAADTWNESQSNEQGTLGGYETILNQYNPNGSNVKKNLIYNIYNRRYNVLCRRRYDLGRMGRKRIQC